MDKGKRKECKSKRDEGTEPPSPRSDAKQCLFRETKIRLGVLPGMLTASSKAPSGGFEQTRVWLSVVLE